MSTRCNRMTLAALMVAVGLIGLPGCRAGTHEAAAQNGSGAAAQPADQPANQTADQADDDGGGPYTKPSDAELRQRLTPLQYQVTQQAATEPPFHNAYWDNHREGIYVDIVTGEPLFSSREKFESGTGWPSFWKPLVPANVVEKEDKSLFVTRTEVLSKHGGSHLGHVFDDGPPPTGLRYCLDSAALRFIPVEDLEKEGYGRFLSHFQRDTSN
jgi:methionine-R-sulfoxide reductase